MTEGTSVILQMSLKDGVRPSTGDWRKVRKDPLFCTVCCNFSPGVVYSIIPRTGTHWASELIPAGPTSNLFKPLPERGRCEVSARYKDILQAASAGCASCLVLKSGIEIIRDQNPFGIKGSMVDLAERSIEVEFVFAEGSVLRLSVLWNPYADDEEDEVWPCTLTSPRENNDLLFRVEFYTLRENPCPWPAIGSAMAIHSPYAGGKTVEGGLVRHVHYNTLSEECLTLLRQWIEDCDNSHLTCQVARTSAANYLPDRLISLGLKEHSSIKLLEVETSALKGDERYAALSHCWGKTKQLCTTNALISSWKSEIPDNLLTKTFRDAIMITRMLGIQYIWIDSLCIVQDNLQDWETQAAAMGLVYRHAYIVISATGAVDGNAGCFFEKPCFVTLQGKDPTHHQSCEIYLREPLDHSPFGWSSTMHQNKNDYDRRTDINEVPTFSRAWCLQERLLAPRILHFTKSEVIFECLDSLNCECGAMMDYKKDQLFESRQMLHGCNTMEEASHSEANNVALDYYQMTCGLRMTWRDLVEIYSEKEVTHRKDALSAIAGVARIWSTNLGRLHPGDYPSYLAGIWSCDIRLSLLWVPIDTEPQSEDGPGYIAPSWSWASAQRAVRFYQADEETNTSQDTVYHAEIGLGQTCCVKAGVDEFGQVASGWLRITGHVVRAQLLEATINDPKQRKWVKVVRLCDPTPDPTVQSNYSSFTPDLASRCDELLGSEVLCLPLCTQKSRNFTQFIVLGPARKKSLDRLPDHILRSPSKHFVERLGLIEIGSVFSGWEEEQAEILDFYII